MLPDMSTRFGATAFLYTRKKGPLPHAAQDQAQ
jgi:hypothetical protein